MHTLPKPGSPVTVDYRSPNGAIGTASGIVLDSWHTHTHLTVDAGHHTPMAIPLDRVTRVNGALFDMYALPTGRCYREFCCNTATHEVKDFGEGKSGPFNPSTPVYEYRGRWGLCSQHLSDTSHR